jgi:hypothetical protein
MTFDLKDHNFDNLVGKTLSSITVGGPNGGDDVVIETVDGATYRMWHEQDCCENVSVEEVVGDLTDLVGSPILMAEEVSQNDDSQSDGTGTWTFYKLATAKGYVTIRWYGSSNGYYSESVSFARVK